MDAASYLKTFESVYAKKEQVPNKKFKVFIFVKSSECLDDDTSTPYRLFHTAQKRGLKPILVPSESSSIDLLSFPARVKDHEKKEHLIERGDLVLNRVNIHDSFGSALLFAAQRSGAFILNKFESCYLAENKYLATHFLKDNGFSVPDSFVLTKNQDLIETVKKVKPPVVLKSFYGSGGIGVSLVESKRSFLSHVQNYLEKHQNVLVQDFVESKEDYRILVLGGKAIAAVKRSVSEFDFRSNLSLGAKHSPYEPSDLEIDVCERISKKFDLFYCAIDYVKKDKEVVVLEVNCYAGSNDEYFSIPENKNISGDELIGFVFDEIQKRNWRPDPTNINLIENMEILSAGVFEAKVDTGNDSVNSLHAEDIRFLGDKASFSVNGKSFKKTVVDTVKIRQGDKVERRYVVEFDVKFHGREIKNVRFNLNNRDKLKYNVLIGLKFLAENNFCVLPF